MVCGLLMATAWSWSFTARAAESSLPPTSLTWKRLAALPEPRGLAAAFAGLAGNELLVGGGANFPDLPPWKGGTKTWHDRVWALKQVDEDWRDVGRLPRPLAYGVSIGTPEGLVCIGGSDAEKHGADVFRLSLREGQLETAKLPALPRPVANACGAMLRNVIYVAGGSNSPQAIKTLGTFFALDLAVQEPRWRELESWPGPQRMLAVAAAQEEGFYLMSGVSLSADSEGRPIRTYLKDAYCFRPGKGWKRLAELPRPVAAAPSPALSVAPTRLLVVGGDDGARVGFQPPQDHPGFANAVLEYETSQDIWRVRGKTPAPSVTAPTVQWGARWLILSGEVRPGVRSPEIWSVELAPR